MTNHEVCQALDEIAQLLELSGENPFKTRSYENVARTIEQMEEDLEDLVKAGRLREIKGVGDALEQKITELVTTGRLEYLEKLRERFPATLFELFRIPGLGAKRIRQLYDDLGIASLAALETALDAGALKDLKGFGAKMEEKLRAGIAFTRGHEGLFRADVALAEAERLQDWLKSGPGIQRIEVAGSLRRRKEIVKDLDIIASSDTPKAVMERFLAAKGVSTITGHGETKTSVVLESGIAADLRVVSDEQYPYALMHFTGCKDHNVVMRQRAKDRGLKLNEYGLFHGEELVRCPDEPAIHRALGLPYIPPELRENMGEFELTETPSLVDQNNLRGIIHCHTTYSDGRATLEEMASAAQARGYDYLVLADHSHSAAYAHGMSPDTVIEQHNAINHWNNGHKGFRVLKGIECDIRNDGTMDYDPDVLSRFDLVIASIHSHLEMQEDEATARIVKAIESPYTDILGHPTGRLLLARKGYPLDYDKVFDACVANGVAIEINANPYRLDLDWRQVRHARDRGIMMAICPDAHDIEGLDDVMYGVGIARKGWLAPEHVLNCMTTKELLKWRRSR